MAQPPDSRVDSVYLSYLPNEGAPSQQPVSASTPSEPVLRRPLNLGIATKAARSAAHQPSPSPTSNGSNGSRVQQKLQSRNNHNTPNSRDVHSNAPRPFELRSNPAVVKQPSMVHVTKSPNSQPRQQQQQQSYFPPQPTPPITHQQQHRPTQHSNLRPQIPTLQVTVPPPAAAMGAQYSSRQQGPQQYASSSEETLVGSNSLHEKMKHGQAYPQPHARGMEPPRSPYAQYPNGLPSPSPSIKNLQLQIPTLDRTAHPENDRLSPAGGVGSQRDWWKRFSTVVRENEEKEKEGSNKGATKVQSEWLDKQSHRQRNYRIWVGVVALLIIAAIGGGLAYHFLIKDKNADQASTQPKTQDFGLGTTTSYDPRTADTSTSVRVQAAPSAVAPGSVIPTNGLRARGIAEDPKADEVDYSLPLVTPAAPAASSTSAAADAVAPVAAAPISESLLLLQQRKVNNKRRIPEHRRHLQHVQAARRDVPLAHKQ